MAARKRTKAVSAEQLVAGFDDQLGALFANAPSEPKKRATTPVEEVKPVVESKLKNGIRVSFHERPTRQLKHIDLDEFGDVADVKDAYVKVTARIRPSERSAIDASLKSLRTQLQEAGARAVLFAVTPVAEGPSSEAKKETTNALSPEDAIGAWFDGLVNVPPEEREEAKARALKILESEV